MAITVVLAKGQIRIPKAVRERLGWSAGTELEVEELEDSIVIRAHPDVPRSTLAEVLGCLPYRGPATTIAEMNAAVAKLARRRARS